MTENGVFYLSKATGELKTCLASLFGPYEKCELLIFLDGLQSRATSIHMLPKQKVACFTT